MTGQEKRLYNYENEQNYHYAPFSEARKELRKIWNQTRKCWDTFLFEAEKKFQQNLIVELKEKIYLNKEDRELFLNANKLILKLHSEITIKEKRKMNKLENAQKELNKISQRYSEIRKMSNISDGEVQKVRDVFNQAVSNYHKLDEYYKARPIKKKQVNIIIYNEQK